MASPTALPVTRPLVVTVAKAGLLDAHVDGDKRPRLLWDNATVCPTKSVIVFRTEGETLPSGAPRTDTAPGTADASGSHAETRTQRERSEESTVFRFIIMIAVGR